MIGARRRKAQSGVQLRRLISRSKTRKGKRSAAMIAAAVGIIVAVDTLL